MKICGVRVKRPALRIIRGSFFQNRRRHRVIRRVAQADEQIFCAARLEQFFSLAVQHHERLAGFLAADFHVLPAELHADAGAKRLGNRLLGREPRGDERRGIFMRQTVSDFVRVQNPVEKPLAEPLMRRLHPRDLDDVNAHAQNHGIYDLRFTIDAQANSEPCFNMTEVMDI